MAQSAWAETPISQFSGTWAAEPYQLPLTLSTDFDVSVWGKGATSVRDVALRIEKSGEATLTVTRPSLEVRFDTPDGRGSFWAELQKR